MTASRTMRQRRRRHDNTSSSWLPSILPTFQNGNHGHYSTFAEKSMHGMKNSNNMRMAYCIALSLTLIAIVSIFWIGSWKNFRSGFSIASRGPVDEFQRRSPAGQHHSTSPNSQVTPFGKKRSVPMIEYVELLDLSSSSKSSSQGGGSNLKQYDVVIVGCGPAGLTASLFASQLGLSSLTIGSPSAGSLSGTDRLYNFPSFYHGDVGGANGSSGQGWLDMTMQQASSLGSKFAPPTWLATELSRTKLDQNNPSADYELDDPSQFILEISLSALGPAAHASNPLHSSNNDKIKTVAAAIRARTVIIASGSRPRKLGLANEKALWGRSLHNCALCDGDSYATARPHSNYPDNQQQTNDEMAKRGKSVAVIGGGDAAVEAISLLHQMGVDTIHWIHRRKEFKASLIQVERIRRLSNVQIWTPYIVVEWITKEKHELTRNNNSGFQSNLMLDGVRIVPSINGKVDSEETSSLVLPCDGAFLMIGSTPNTDWLKSSGMEIDSSSGLVRLMMPPSSVSPASTKASEMMNVAGNSKDNTHSSSLFMATATSIPGVFAAGEATDGIYRQALTAASEGAKAAMDAERWLRHQGLNDNFLYFPNNNEAVDMAKSPKQYQEEADDDAPTQIDTVAGCDLTTEKCITSFVSSRPVVVFSKPLCPYCRRALEALQTEMANHSKPYVVDLTDMENGWKVQETLGEMTGRFTVPNVFIGGKSVGGGDETVALYEEGRLGRLLRDAGAIR